MEVKNNKKNIYIIKKNNVKLIYLINDYQFICNIRKIINKLNEFYKILKFIRNKT
jgi:hypothetical protein